MHIVTTNIAGAAAALIVALAATPSIAQTQPGAPLPGQPGAVYPGGVYPGAGATPGAATHQGQPAAAAAQPQQALAQPVVGQPGTPGTPVAGASAGVPSLPPLPGANAVNASQLATDDVMPADIPGQVRVLRQRMDEFARASATAGSTLPKPVSRTETITQAAGEKPMNVRLAMGVPSAVMFVDATGQPWPIEYATPGDPNKFEVLMPVPGTASLELRPRQAYGWAGLTVKLRGNNVPIPFTLTFGQGEVDSRLDLRVAGRGPNAVAPIIDRVGMPGPLDAPLLSFLDGVPPQGARVLKTDSKSVKAWVLGDRLVVRSDMPVVSPAWSDSYSSPNGATNAYVLPLVPSILVSVDGRITPVKIDN